MEKLGSTQKFFLECLFYPTPKIKQIFIEEIYEKLYKLLPVDKMFAYENLIEEVRVKNYWESIQIISKFMQENPSYMKRMRKVYNGESDFTVIQMVLMNFVYVCGDSIDMYRDMNFANIPECILYGDSKLFNFDF